MKGKEVSLVVAEFLAKAFKECKIAILQVFHEHLEIFDLHEHGWSDARVSLRDESSDALGKAFDQEPRCETKSENRFEDHDDGPNNPDRPDWDTGQLATTW